MKKYRIAYLAPQYLLDFEHDEKSEIQTNINRAQAIVKHQRVAIYTMKAFEEAFNDEDISDQGYIAIVDEDNNLIIPQ